MAEKTIDGYIAGLKGWQAEVASRVREIVRGAAPEAKEGIKWAVVLNLANGAPTKRN
jgi:hypothetical protein